MDGTTPDDDDSSVRRRRFVKGLGALSIVGLAGCGGNDGTETLNTVADPVTTTGMTGTSTPTDTPVNPALPSGAPQRSNAEAYFSLDQESLPATNELNGTDATMKGDPTAGASGQAGTAFDFDGDGDAFNYPGSLGITYDGTTNWTTSLWINPDNIPGSGSVTLWRPHDYNYWFNLYSDGNIKLGTWDGSNVNTVSSGTQPATDSWTHVAVVSDTSKSDQYRIYFDGSQVASGNVPDPATKGNEDMFGGNTNGDKDYFDGQIDEVYVYSTALSDSEVNDLYNTAT